MIARDRIAVVGYKQFAMAVMGHFYRIVQHWLLWAVIEFEGVDGGMYGMCSICTHTRTFLSIFEINEWFMGDFGLVRIYYFTK